jgi:predicted phosphatase
MSLPWYDVSTIKHRVEKIRNKAIAIRKLVSLVSEAVSSADYRVAILYIDMIEEHLKDIQKYCGDMRTILIKNGVTSDEGKN